VSEAGGNKLQLGLIMAMRVPSMPPKKTPEYNIMCSFSFQLGARSRLPAQIAPSSTPMSVTVPVTWVVLTTALE
jgi:hypothetical protein